MLIRAISTVLLVSITSPASADGTQLERNLNVAPNTFSASELALLRDAHEKGDRHTVIYLNSPDRVGPGAAADVARGTNHPADRQIIEAAAREHDFNRIRFVTMGSNSRTDNALQVVKRDAARAAGLDADDHSLARIYAILDARQD